MERENRKFGYSMVRIVCNGKIKTCEFCASKENVEEGYCEKCGRPLWKKPGENCNFIVGYHDRNYHQQNKVHIKCKFCNTVISV